MPGKSSRQESSQDSHRTMSTCEDQGENDIKCLIETVNKMSNKVANLQQSMNSNHSELKVLIDRKVKAVKDDLQIEIATVTSAVQALERRMDEQHKKREYDVDTTIVIHNMGELTNETENDVWRKVERLIFVGLELLGIEVIACKRLKGRNDKPGIIKAEFMDLATKVEVLRAKSKLRSKSEFRNIYVASSEEH